MSISIPASPMKRKMVIPISDPGHVANRAFPPATTTTAAHAQATRIQQPSVTRAGQRVPVGGDHDAEAIQALGADVPEAIASRPTVPGGMRPAFEFRPGGHQPSQPSGRGGTGPVPTDTSIPNQRPYAGPPPSGALAPAPPRQATPMAGARAEHFRVHQRMTPRRIDTDWMADLPPGNRGEIAAMSRHAQAGCQTCAAHLNGIARGAKWAGFLTARRAKAEAQAAADERLAATRPNEYIAQMARRARTPGIGQAIAVANIDRTVLAQAPKQPIATRW